MNEQIDLSLNLSPPSRHNLRAESPSRSLTPSPASSCISSELNQAAERDDDGPILRYSSSPEDTPMMLVGCPRCFMYVMHTEEDPRCPKCKSTGLFDIFHDNNISTTMKTANRKP